MTVRVSERMLAQLFDPAVTHARIGETTVSNALSNLSRFSFVGRGPLPSRRIVAETPAAQALLDGRLGPEYLKLLKGIQQLGEEFGARTTLRGVSLIGKPEAYLVDRAIDAAAASRQVPDGRRLVQQIRSFDRPIPGAHGEYEHRTKRFYLYIPHTLDAALSGTVAKMPPAQWRKQRNAWLTHVIVHETAHAGNEATGMKAFMNEAVAEFRARHPASLRRDSRRLGIPVDPPVRGHQRTLDRHQYTMYYRALQERFNLAGVRKHSEQDALVRLSRHQFEREIATRIAARYNVPRKDMPLLRERLAEIYANPPVAQQLHRELRRGRIEPLPPDPARLDIPYGEQYRDMLAERSIASMGRPRVGETAAAYEFRMYAASAGPRRASETQEQYRSRVKGLIESELNFGGVRAEQTSVRANFQRWKAGQERQK